MRRADNKDNPHLQTKEEDMGFFVEGGVYSDIYDYHSNLLSIGLIDKELVNGIKQE